MPNRLAHENSPYLLQHAENPVDWYPWGPEALGKARREDKPVFLSIGYAACHWCHVMAHESFEDPQIADIMNRYYVNIKVDREERPDLDSIYMSAVIAMTGQGGWPMSIFLTPDGQPFYGGTYFPPVRRYNMPSFREVLVSVHNAWEQDRGQILQSSHKIAQYISQAANYVETAKELDPGTIGKASFTLAQSYDWKNGGWGSAPKFPQPMTLEFLLRQASKGDNLARDIAIHCLHAMAKGGMYDVIGGGFARYSTDDYWLVPHFEKMLYDNAQLALVYLHGYLISGELFFRQVCEATLDFILREMAHPLGGFFSSLDADSEGIEGKYYVWTPQQIRSALQNEDDSAFILAAYNITDTGNFEGDNVLQRALDDSQLAGQFGIPTDRVQEHLDRLHKRLLAHRQTRVRPATDDKVLVIWNSLVLAAFAEAARYLDRPDYLAAARTNADFLLGHLIVDGRLQRSWREGQARQNAFLEDVAGLALGLLSLYQSDPDLRWYQAADRLVSDMIAHYQAGDLGFYDTRDEDDPLIIRPKDLQDNATPSGNALAALALLQFSAYTGSQSMRSLVSEMLGAIQDLAARYPTAFSQWLCALDTSHDSPYEVAILGLPGDPGIQVLQSAVWQRYRPYVVLAVSTLPIPDGAPPLLEGRDLIRDLATAYICRNFVCLAPTTSVEQILIQLERDPTGT